MVPRSAWARDKFASVRRSAGRAQDPSIEEVEGSKLAKQNLIKVNFA